MTELTEKQKKRAENFLNEVEQAATIGSPRTIAQTAKERIEEKKLEAIAPKWGYPEFDEIVAGAVPGHLYTMTGVENVGKTSLACNFAVRVSKQGKTVLYFALEPENSVVDYIASVRFNKEFQNLTEEDISYDDGRIFIYGKQEVRTVEQLVEIIRGSAVRYDLVIIDHIGYFIRDNKNYIQEQSNTLKVLAGLAKEKRCAIMLIAHLRKRSQNQKPDYIPTSDDIAGSGAFKQDSTDVVIVTKDVDMLEGGGVKYRDTGKLWVTKTKAGKGGTGVVDLFFFSQKALIVDLATKRMLERNQEPLLQEKKSIQSKLDAVAEMKEDDDLFDNMDF